LDIDEIIRRKKDISVYEGGFSDDKTKEFMQFKPGLKQLSNNFTCPQPQS